MRGVCAEQQRTYLIWYGPSTVVKAPVVLPRCCRTLLTPMVLTENVRTRRTLMSEVAAASATECWGTEGMRRMLAQAEQGKGGAGNKASGLGSSREQKGEQAGAGAIPLRVVGREARAPRREAEDGGVKGLLEEQSHGLQAGGGDVHALVGGALAAGADIQAEVCLGHYAFDCSVDLGQQSVQGEAREAQGAQGHNVLGVRGQKARHVLERDVGGGVGGHGAVKSLK